MKHIDLRNSTVLILAIFVFALTAQGAAGDLDTTFGGTGKVRLGFGGAEDFAAAAARQADNKLVVAGDVVEAGSRTLAVVRYNEDGSLDTTFGSGGKVVTFNGSATSAAAVRIQTDGKIVVVANIGTGFQIDIVLLRYNSDGALDQTFGVGGRVRTDISNSSTDYAHAMVIQTDGKIVVAGTVGTNNNADFAVLRYNTNGALDTSFDGDGKVITDVGIFDEANAVTLQDDGRIIVAGGSSVTGQNGTFAVVRYLANGTLDPVFGNAGKVLTAISNNGSSATAVAFQKGNGMQANPDRIIVSGSVANNLGIGFAVAKYTLGGALDTNFDTDGFVTLFFGTGSSFATAMLTQGTTAAPHKIIVAGYSSAAASGEDFSIVRFNANGSLDTTFNGDGIATTPVTPENDRILAMTFQSGITVVGSVGPTSNKNFGIVRYNSTNGALDTGFDGDGIRNDDFGNASASADSTAIQADGKVVVVGTTFKGATVVRYTANGSPDASFDGDGIAFVPLAGSSAGGVAIQTDGKIIVAGNTGGSEYFVARYNPNGSLDTTFDGDGIIIVNTSLTSLVTDVAIQSDGKIVVGGGGTSNGSVYSFMVARHNTNGSLDTSFANIGFVFTSINQNSFALALAIQTDGKIVVGGNSQISSNNTDFAILRYNINGSLDTSFDGDGIAITPFGTNADTAYDIAIQTDGKIVAAGHSFNGTRLDFALARYNPNGSLDNSFENDGKVITQVGAGEAGVRGVAIQPDGKILAAGFALDQGFKYAVVRYNPNGLLDNAFWNSSQELYGSGGKVFVDVSDGDDTGNGIALDSFGRAVVVGSAGGLFGVIRLQGDSTVPNGRAPFDYDGDGKTDIGIFRASDGSWWYSRSSDGQVRVFNFGQPSDIIAPGDYTGDGKADVAIFRPSNGFWFVLRSEDNSFFSFPFGTSGDVPAPADYDGDGKSDAAVFRPSSSTWYVRRSSDFGTSIVQFGVSTDKPVAADYDGDGKADFAIFRPSDGSWWYLRSIDLQYRVYQFGVATDKPVQGDWTGDGKADLAFFRPSNGFWFVQRSEDNSFYSVPFGTNGDLPAPGDYDGDGKFDTAVFRPSTANWFVNRSTAGILITTFGTNGDRPIPNAFVP